MSDLKGGSVRYLFIILVVLISGCSTTSSSNKSIDLKKAAEANVKLGAAYLQQGMLGAANEKLEKALEQNPKSPQAHNMYAVLMGQLGKTRVSEKHYKKALNLDPDSSEIRNNYGSFLCNQGRVDDAVEQFQMALLDPLYQTPEYAFANAGACVLKIPDFVRAEEFLRKALQRNENLPSALFQMAKLNYLKGRYVPSKTYLDRYHTRSGKGPASLWLGIKLAWQLNDKQAAASYSLLLKNKFPDSPEAQKLIQAESTRRR